MSLEESNKMSQKIPSQDSLSEPKVKPSFEGCYNYDKLKKEGLVDGEPEWKLEDLQKAIIDSAEMYDELLDKAGQHELPAQTAEAMWEMERHMWSQRQRQDGVDESSF